jgi:hypothetical protein
MLDSFNLPRLAGAQLRGWVSRHHRRRIAQRDVDVDIEAVEHGDAVGGVARAGHGNEVVDYIHARSVLAGG